MNIRTSIIMPVKNGELFIKESIESVLTNISNQDEMIIIDDGSSDRTNEIIYTFIDKHKNISLYHGNNLLPSGARNLGLEKARGTYISFIDHDDLWPKNRLNHHLSLLEQKRNIDIIQGMVQYFSSEPSKLAKFKFLDPNQLLFFFQLGSFTYRREVFNKIGFFSPDLKFGEDVDFYTRIIDEKINILKDTNIALLYRIHDTNMTHNHKENNSHVLVKILKDSIRRKKIGAFNG